MKPWLAMDNRTEVSGGEGTKQTSRTETVPYQNVTIMAKGKLTRITFVK